MVDTCFDDFPLPLTLLSFTLEKNNGSALLKWTVTDEINTSFFEVQRSINGLNFLPVGTVAAVRTGSAIRIILTWIHSMVLAPASSIIVCVL